MSLLRVYRYKRVQYLVELVQDSACLKHQYLARYSHRPPDFLLPTILMFTSKNYKFDKNLGSYRNEVLKNSFTKYK